MVTVVMAEPEECIGDGSHAQYCIRSHTMPLWQVQAQLAPGLDAGTGAHLGLGSQLHKARLRASIGQNCGYGLGDAPSVSPLVITSW